MTLLQERRAPVRRHRQPDERQILEEGFKARCPQCWFVWPASVMTQEDGIDRCPNCVDVITEESKAEAWERAAARIERHVLEPQISQAPLSSPVPPAIDYITDAAGVVLTPSAEPLILRRDVNTTMALVGVNFSASDVITYSAGISDAVPIERTPMLTTLTLVASLATPPGNHYHMTFNGQTYRDIFRVQ